MNFAELRESATLFEALAGFGLTSLHVSGADAQPLEATAQTLTGDYLDALGVRPAVGRLLRAEETTRRADPSVVVISERLWGSLFGRAPDVVGRQIRANGHTLTVIGVAGGGFSGPWRGLEVDAWLPLSALTTVVGFPPERLESRSTTMVRDFVARLKPGVSTAAAEAQLRALTRRLAEAHPEPNEYLNGIVPRVHRGVAVRPLIRERTYSTVRLLLAVVALVLGSRAPTS